MERSTTLASPATITATIAALQNHNFNAISVDTRAQALDKIKMLIPQGASVMNGSSRTLEEIGYIEYLKSGAHGWNNLHEAIVNETDAAKKAALRKQAVNSDYYLGSVHAATQTGELVFASASGSQMPHLVFTSQHIILVVGTHKIVPTINDAFDRIRSILPLEDARMKSVYGPESGTTWAKTLILNQEVTRMGRSVQIIFVNEVLGF